MWRDRPPGVLVMSSLATLERLVLASSRTQVQPQKTVLALCGRNNLASVSVSPKIASQGRCVRACHSSRELANTSTTLLT